MKKILVSILSDHLVPNYLFIKEMQGQFNDLLFIGTPYTEEKRIAAHLEDALGMKENSVVKVIVESDLYQKGLRILAQTSFPREAHYIVNLTGGTKIMALMVYEFFCKFDTSFYYVPIRM